MPKVAKRTKTVWKGPEEDGITQSLLSRFLCCRERFRLLVVEGLQPADAFNHLLEYGNMWHMCEETLAAQHSPVVTDGTGWQSGLKKYCQKLCEKYPLQQIQIDKWYNVCKVQFPIYIEYWCKHPDVKKRIPLLQEEVFCVPYKLPSGRTVKLRGKWDSVDLIGTGKKAGIWLQENKTKGEIKEEQLVRQLTFDLQTMIYLIALQLFQNDGDRILHDSPIKGVRYNVVRRPLSGGKHSISQKKGSKNVPPQTTTEFYNELSGRIEDNTEFFFMRWNVEIVPAEIERFKREFLNPILEQLCDWWSCQSGGRVNPYSSCYQSFRMPFGVYNPMLEGRASELDEYLASGSELGLERTTKLFKELD